MSLLLPWFDAQEQVRKKGFSLCGFHCEALENMLGLSRSPAIFLLQYRRDLSQKSGSLHQLHAVFAITVQKPNELAPNIIIHETLITLWLSCDFSEYHSRINRQQWETLSEATLLLYCFTSIVFGILKPQGPVNGVCFFNVT